MAIEAGSKDYLQFAINETDTLAGTPQQLISPVAGYLTGLQLTVQKAVTTGGAVTVEINGVAVGGLTVTVADGAAAGTRYSDKATLGVSTRAVAVGDKITVTPAAAFATAGAIAGNVIISSTLTGEA